MTLLFRDRSREEPLPSLLIGVIVDTLKTAPREHYAMWSQDVRYALRMMVKNPGFTLVAALSLALGTGAAASIFSLADALVLRPLPVARPGEVMTLRAKADDARYGANFFSFSWRDYLDYREKSRSFTDLLAFDTTSISLAADAKARVPPQGWPDWQYGPRRVLPRTCRLRGMLMSAAPLVTLSATPPEVQTHGAPSGLQKEKSIDWAAPSCISALVRGRPGNNNLIRHNHSGVSTSSKMNSSDP